MLNAPPRIEWHVTAWQQQNNVGCRQCDTEKEAAEWMRYWHKQGYVVKIKRIVRVVQ